MTGFDVTRLLPSGPDVFHHDGPIVTDGPWLIFRAPGGDGLGPLERILPSHATVSVDVCTGDCRAGG